MKGKTLVLTLLLSGLGTMLIAQPASISPPTLPDGLYGSPYQNQTLTVGGGTPPYSFSVSSGQLPPGMNISSGGVLSGTPSATGKYSFTVTAQGQSPGPGPGHGHGNGNGPGNGPGPSTATQNYTLTVDPAALTITANNTSMDVGGPLPSLSASYSGFTNGDNASSLTRIPSITTTATASSPPGTYSITLSGASDPNYTIRYKSGTLTVKAGSVHVTANAQNKQYGQPDPPLTYSVSGLPAGVSPGILTGSLSRSPGENAGIYPITIGSLSAGNNYAISFTGNDLTITKSPQQIAWSQSLLVGCNATTELQLNAAASSGLPVTYSVTDNGVASVSGNVLTLLKPGTAVVTARQSGNGNYDGAPAVTDTVEYAPASLIAPHWNDVILFDNSSGDYIGWQWYKNGDPVTGDTAAYYTESPYLDGAYYVIATNRQGQHVQSCTLTITDSAGISGGIKVFPNPAAKGSTVTVVVNYVGSALQGAVLQVADISGRVLQQVTDVQPSMQLTMPAANGIYIVNLVLADGQRVSTNVLLQ